MGAIQSFRVSKPNFGSSSGAALGRVRTAIVTIAPAPNPISLFCELDAKPTLREVISRIEGRAAAKPSANRENAEFSRPHAS